MLKCDASRISDQGRLAVTKSWTTRRCGRTPTVSATLEALGSAVVRAKFIKWTVEDDRDRNTNALTPSQARNWIDTKSVPGRHQVCPGETPSLPKKSGQERTNNNQRNQQHPRKLERGGTADVRVETRVTDSEDSQAKKFQRYKFNLR